MKQSLTDIFSVDEFGVDDARAGRVYETVPRNHFIETDQDRIRQDVYDRVLPRLTTSLERRIAAMLILDDSPVTIPQFRELGITRKELTEAKKRVQKVMQSI